MRRFKLQIGAAILAGGLILGGGAAAITSFNDHTLTVTITEKMRIVDGDDSKYIIWGEDEYGNIHAFENTDSLFRWKWNSSDVQGNLRVGETYELNLIGYRIPFLSCYENILSYDSIDEEETDEELSKGENQEKPYDEMTTEEKIAFLEAERESLLQEENNDNEYNIETGTYTRTP